MIRRIIFLAVLLVALLYLGAVAIPTLIAESGVVVYEGTTYSIPEGNYVAIPFSVQTSSKIAGAFSSDRPISLLISNSTQFLNYVDGQGAYAFEINSTTGASFVTILPKGSYYLIFNSYYDVASPATIRVTVTGSIQLSQIQSR